MSMSQPVSSSNEDHLSKDEPNLKDFIIDWKKKTRTNSQYDRIKRWIFSYNQKPTDFNAKDFFPPIPDSELVSDSEETAIETISKERKSLSKRKLDYQTCQENEHQNSDISQLQDGEKQRRQPLSSLNELTNLKSVSPIISPSKTTRNVLKLKRASLLQQINQDDQNVQYHCQFINNNNLNHTAQEDNQLDNNYNQSTNKNNFQTRLSSTIINFDSPLVSNQSSFKKTLRKQAVNDSFKSKSTNLSLMANKIERMDTSPLSLVADQFINRHDELLKLQFQKRSNQVETKSPPKIDPIHHDQTRDEFFKPPTPPAIKISSKSSITITKRKSNEPLKDIQIDLSTTSVKPKILTRTISSSKINTSVNDSQNELINIQSNNFVRRSSFGNNRTVNSTVNSSASVLFKPIKKTSIKQFPPPPLFNQSNNAIEKKTDTSYDDTDYESKNDAIKKKKIKKLTKIKETRTKNPKIDKNHNLSTKEESNLENFNKKSSENYELLDHLQKEKTTQEPEPANEHVLNNNELVEGLDIQSNTNNEYSLITRSSKKSKITSYFTNSSKKQIHEKIEDELLNDKRKKSKNQTKSSKKTSNNQLHSKRQPLKNIDNENQFKHSKEKSQGYFANNKTVLFDKNNETNKNQEQENPSVPLRRSKRAKLDKNSQPVYGYETIQDYKGNKCIVRTLIGTKDKIDVKINQEIMKNFFQVNKKKETRTINTQQNKTPIKSKKLSQKNLKKIEQSNEIHLENNDNDLINASKNTVQDSMIEQNQLIQKFSNNENQNRGVEIGQIKSFKNNSLSITALNRTECMENSQVNKSYEIAYVRKDDLTKEAEAIHLYFFHKHLENKEYEFCSNGVGICPLSDVTGLIRIENNNSTRTSNHESSITYFVQRGSCIFSINGTISIHNEKDVIHVPSSKLY